MSTLLSLRTDLRNLLDEPVASTWQDSELLVYLNQAIEHTAQLAASKGLTSLHQTTSFTAAAGVITTSATRLIKILSVREVVGSQSYLVNAVRPNDVVVASTASPVLSITHISVPTALILDADQLIWAPGLLSNELLDSLTVCFAAKKAKIKDGEINPALDSYYEILRKDLEESCRTSQVVVMPFSSFDGENISDLAYTILNQGTISLARRCY